MLELRPYQRETLGRIKQAYKEGKRRVLVSLPTGTGKTVVFAHFPETLRMKKRLLVLAHREELLLQAQDKFRTVNPELKVELERAGEHASADAQVVVASVPSLARGHGKRLSRLPPEDFSIIVVDEAHHAVAPSYKRIFEHFRVFEPGTTRYLVGFTATPRRGDNQGLGEVFEEVCYARDLRQMIDDGFLAPITGWRVSTDVSLDTVKVRHGDFVESQLGQVVNTEIRNDLLVAAYRRFAAGRRAIVFCVDVAHAQAVQLAFQEGGVRSGVIWGDLPMSDRRDRLASFARGDFDVITNCNILTEGFDEPRVDCVIMARPTRSKLLYAQMVGRGTRLHPDKSNLLVIDVADNSRVHQLPGLHSLFNLPLNMNLQGRPARAIEQAVERINRRQPWIDTSRIHTPQDLEVVAERIEFFKFDLPDELLDTTRNIWHGVPGGYRLHLPNGSWLSVASTLLDTWDVEHVTPPGSKALIQRAPDLPAAIQAADQFIARTLPDAGLLVERFARWRRQEPTEKQKQVLAQHDIKVADQLTRGQAAQIIAFIMSTRRKAS